MSKQSRTIDPQTLIRSRVANMGAYYVETFPCTIALDANESPYPLPAKLMERLWALMAGTAFNRYPDGNGTPLKRAIVDKDGADESEILLGNGSDECIQGLIATVCDPGDRILIPTPTFSMFRLIANYLNVDTVEVPLLDDWSVDADRFVDTIKKEKPKIIFLATPNNPTGNRFSREAIDAILEVAEGVVVIDEAYIDYADGEPVGLLYRDIPNVAIIRTLSKIGLAAMRIGYMMADREIIHQVNKVRLPYNINSVTQAVATLVLRSWSEITPSFDAIKKERAKLFDRMQSFEGVTPYPSEANFILARLDQSVGKVSRSLTQESGVRVRWFGGASRLGNCFRVTIGAPVENDSFILALEGALL